MVWVYAAAGLGYSQREDGTCVGGGYGIIVPDLGEEQTEVGRCTGKVFEVNSAMGWRPWLCSPERESTVDGRGFLARRRWTWRRC